MAASSKDWQELGLLVLIGVVAAKHFGVKAAEVQAAVTAALPPPINPTPPQVYTTPGGGPFQAGGLGYSPYAGYNGRGAQPGSQTGAFHG